MSRSSQEGIVQVRRGDALIFASAYRTVSETANLLIALLTPVALSAREVGKEARSLTLVRWQISWEQGLRGQDSLQKSKSELRGTRRRWVLFNLIERIFSVLFA